MNSEDAIGDSEDRDRGETAGPPDEAPLDLRQSPARNSVGFLLAMAAHRFREHYERTLEPLGLQTRHFGILATIRHFGPVPQQRLVNSVCIDRSTMVSLVDELENAGLVERRPDPNDRRAHRVHLTRAGSKAHSAALERLEEIESGLLSGLDEPERAELRRMLAIAGDLDNVSGFEHVNIRKMIRSD